MVRTHGWGEEGKRLVMNVPFGYWLNQTLIAALSCDGLYAPWLLNRPMCRTSFDFYIQTPLAAIFVKGDGVILDNLAAHKSVKAKELLHDKGAWMLFLPPERPDLTP